ncbi:MAG TPA: glycosyltransferase family 1 protein [Patescibacteria group bacterium]|nr:glycosyltransferase family 1 protein [Patescibacteria group bacterium]
MKLAIDGYEANSQQRVGIGRYAAELLRHMAKINQSTVDVYLPDSVKPHMPHETATWKYHIVGPKPFWTFVGFPLALMRSYHDVVFSPTHYIPRWVSMPRVMAIMDVSYLKYPELFRPQDLHKLVNWTVYSVRHAVRIITISEFSKNAIIEAYGVPKSRVVVAYPGLSMRQTTKSSKKRGTPYILSVGTLQPRKNFVRLIEAFATLDDKKIELVIVGKKGWMYDDILNAPNRYGVSDRVRFLDFVPDDELPSLYNSAACFALPSLYEGFGLPVLEAMSYGVPVVVSTSSSLPEIAGEAGIYVDPEDVSNIAKGLTQALTENNVERIKTGKERVKIFTWDKAAEKVMKVLEEVAK